ncbi:SusC/RagA family TonB-linked outer membrane protein [Gelidibacter salicanalis]|uniref:TonB-dependent receptor n=1 Tax=Gelidibacter salicanalis TaxID=291193 RepID=A0A934NIT4_9FLAO|nr:TonB-dependent receptor [Gelidibacter salicanalis]MBJ7881578.1 TonB-dependent receptor [Gelidibacter salicanalis]
MKNRLLIIRKGFLNSLILLVMLISSSGFAQVTNVTGVVTGAEDGLPVPGASVIIKGTDIGAATDFDGNYSINAKIGDVLVFIYLGKKNVELTVSKSVHNVTMTDDVSELEAVVVVGYGTVKKVEVTGAVNRIDAEDIDQFVTSDIASRLQGQIAGVSVSSSSGEPGEAANIQIRGITSLTGSNTPLFVVNGIPQIGDPGLSPNEIETIDVLKDAASTAVYGSRGAAGVILITTKKGSAGAMKVDFEVTNGIQMLRDGTPLMNTEDQLFHEITTFDNFGGFTPIIVNNPEWLNNDNKFDEYVLVNNAKVDTYQLNVSGGTENFSYNASGQLFDQDGSLINSNFKRYNGRITSTYKTDNWQIDGSVAITNENRRRASEGLIVTASRYRPYFPEIDPDADVAIVNSSGGTTTPAIALGQALKRKDDSNRDRTNINLGIRRKLSGNLDFVTNLGSSITNDFRNIFRPRFDLFNIDDGETESDPTRSGVTTSASRTTKFSWDAGLTYKKQFGDHSVTLQGVGTLEEDNNKAFFASIEGISNNAISVLNGGTINKNVGSGFDFTTKRVGTLGRLQYNFKEKYILQALLRYDGSSRFGSDVRWGLFPSVSGAWNVSSESFWKPLKSVVNTFKIRVSHGEVGNDSFDDYEFASTIAPFADYVFSTNDGSVDFGSAIRSYANRDVKWETSVSDNIGVDFGILKNKISLTVDYYRTEKMDMLFPVTLPGSAGAFYDPELTLNVGNMTNQGLEIAANYRAAIGESTFRMGGTFTSNDNEITKVISSGIIYNSNSNSINGDNTSAISVIAEGYEAGAFFLFETDGTIKTQEELDAYKLFPARANAALGDLKYIDTNGDGNITSEDRTYQGSGLADFEYGFNFSWDWNGFDLSMNWFGTVGAEIFNGNKAATYSFQRHQDLVNQWSPENPTSNIPSFRGDSKEHPNYAGTTDIWLENGDYLRLKQITIGYSLPEDVLERIGISKFRLYLSSQNPLTFTKYEGYDPEIGGNSVARRGIDASRYPISTTYSLGLRIAF